MRLKPIWGLASQVASTPLYKDSIFIATDTKQVFVNINGVKTAVGDGEAGPAGPAGPAFSATATLTELGLDVTGCTGCTNVLALTGTSTLQDLISAIAADINARVAV